MDLNTSTLFYLLDPPKFLVCVDTHVYLVLDGALGWTVIATEGLCSRASRGSLFGCAVPQVEILASSITLGILLSTPVLKTVFQLLYRSFAHCSAHCDMSKGMIA
ncbi:hypothetical protein CSKR_103725 [Clonorchis sinensis]|uniref:Uncharacterized protein n=1 Tax=Clonorchis sinensis TaxID=79923 RepID=A0A419QER4_CLOSI|nr:hypothetical protein CSKR_103725 [Clonorchis sinensis]